MSNILSSFPSELAFDYFLYIMSYYVLKIQLLENLCILILSVYAKFEGCAANTVGGAGLLRVTGFFQKIDYCQISPRSCQFDGTDFKLGEHD